MSQTVHAGDAPGTKATPTAAEPTRASERISVLDVLRGFALYGVLLANVVPLYSGRAFMPRSALLAQADVVDQVFLFLLNVFVDGKAMMLLTFLFGLGFALQLQRAEASGRNVLASYLPRLAALALIGVSHVLLLWWGDILWGYALAGAGLVLFRRVRGRKLLLWGLALALIPHFIASLPPVTKALAPIILEPADGAAFRARVLQAITGHDRRLLTVMQVQQTYYHVGRFWVWYFPALLGQFLIGYWAGTLRLFQSAGERMPLFRKLAGWGLGLGLMSGLLIAVLRLLQRRNIVLPKHVWLALGVPSELGVMLLSCGYAAVVVLLMQRAAWSRVLLLIAPVGRMALTTYLGQSLICTFIFYGWGLGLAARIQPARLFPITLAIFFVQILFARAWLARFRYGPMEWVWRSLTYGRVQPLWRE